MRILHILNTIDPAFGGPVEAARQFAIGSPEDVSVEVVTLDTDIAAWQSQWPVRVHTVGKSYTRYRYAPGLAPWLRKNATNFDAVMVHGVWHYQAVGAWLGLRDSGVPYFVIPHGMLHAWFKQTHPLKHVKKALFWHTVVHRALGGAAAVIFLCEEEQRISRTTFALELKAEAIAPLGLMSPQGVGEDLSREQLDLEFPSLRGKRLFLFLGRICRVKACDSLLRSFAAVAHRCADHQLVMCGPNDENWQAELVRLAESLGISHRVTWTGPLYGKQKWCALSAAELFVLPSHCETFPVAVLEALACQTPVLISDRVGIFREIADAGAGIVCSDNQNSLNKALLDWIGFDSTVRSTFRGAALRCFQQHFELRSAVGRQLKIIRDFSNPPRNTPPLGATSSKSISGIRA